MAAFSGGNYEWNGGQGGASGITVTGNNNIVNTGSGTVKPTTDTTTNTSGNDEKKEEEKPTPSYQMFDYVEQRLQLFANRVKKVADKITEYIDKATKTKLIKEQQKALQDQINSLKSAAKVTMNTANDWVKKWFYTDKDNKEQTLNLWEYDFVDKDNPGKTFRMNERDLREGKYDFVRIDDTTEAAKAALEAADKYREMYNSSVDYTSQLQELYNQIEELDHTLLDMPLEELEKELEVTERHLATLTATYDAVSSGRSGIIAAKDMLNLGAFELSGTKNAHQTFDNGPSTGPTITLTEADKMTKVGTSNKTSKEVANAAPQDEAPKDTTAKNDPTLKQLQEIAKNTQIARNTAYARFQELDQARVNAGNSLTRSSGYSGLSANDKKYIETQIKNGSQIDTKKLSSSISSDISKSVKSYNTATKAKIDYNKNEFQKAKDVDNQADKALNDYKKSLSSSGGSGGTKSGTTVSIDLSGLSNSIAKLSEKVSEVASSVQNTAKVQPSKDPIQIAMNRLGTSVAKEIVGVNTSNPKLMAESYKIQNRILDAELKYIKEEKIPKTAKAIIDYQDTVSRLIVDADKKKAEYNAKQTDENKQAWESAKEQLNYAKQKQDELMEQYNQMLMDAAKRTIEIAQKQMENIDNWFNTAVDWTKTWTTKLSKQREVWKALGTVAGSAEDEDREWLGRTGVKAITNASRVDGSGHSSLVDGISYSNRGNATITGGTAVDYLRRSYENELSYMREIQEKRRVQVKAMEDNLHKLAMEGILVESSEEYKKEAMRINELKSEIMDCTIEYNKLLDSMTEDVYFKPIDTMIKNFDNLRKSINQLKGIISPEMMYTEDGDFTQLGVAKFTMDMREYKTAQDQLTKLEQARRNINNLYSVTGDSNALNISFDEYQERLESIQSQERDVLSSMASTRQEIIKDITDRYQTEITYINKLIDARKQEIQKKLEAYQYDKKLRKQTREVQLLEQQTRALNGLKN